MTVTINDKPVNVAPGATLADALAEANAPVNGIATALNGTVVPAAQRAAAPLSEGDTILIIKAFYGG